MNINKVDTNYIINWEQNHPIVPSNRFPFPIPSSEINKPLKNKSFNKFSLLELQKEKEVREKKVEEGFHKLRPRQAKINLIEKEAEVEQLFLELANGAKEVIDQGLEILETFLPHSEEWIRECQSLTLHGQNLLYALDAGLSGMAFIYKNKLLDESEKILEEVKIYCKNNQIKLPAKIKKWEANIKKEREEASSFQSRLETIRTVFGWVEIPLDTFSLAHKIPHGASVTKWMTRVGRGIDFVLSILHLKSSEESMSHYAKWAQTYREWRVKTQASGPIMQPVQTDAMTGASSLKAVLENIQLPTKKYRSAFNRLVSKGRNIQEVRTSLKKFDIELEQNIKSKAQFLFLLSRENGFKNKLLAQYVQYREFEAKLTSVVQTTQNLLLKREAIMEKKVLQLRARTELCKELQLNSRESLIGYIKHQETLEKVTVSALKQMVEKKLELEGKFLKAKSIETRTSFAFSAGITVCSVVLGTLTLLAMPTFAMGLLLLRSLTVASTAAGFGFMALGYYMSYKFKHSSFNLKTYFETLSQTFNQLRLSIEAYRQISKQTKLRTAEANVHKLHLKHWKKDDPEVKRVFEDYKKAKLEFDLSQNKIVLWQKQAKQLENHLKHKAWQDFVKYADLKISDKPEVFDTLNALTRGLKELDLSLLDAETQTFLKAHLGVNLKELQSKIQTNPQIIEEALQNFFAMDESELVQFMKG